MAGDRITSLSNPEPSIQRLRQLNTKGSESGIADFGTDSSSASHLKTLPLDVLTADLSFVKGISTNAEDYAIIQSIISSPHSLDLDMSADGIQTDAQTARVGEPPAWCRLTVLCRAPVRPPFSAASARA